MNFVFTIHAETTARIAKYSHCNIENRNMDIVGHLKPAGGRVHDSEKRDVVVWICYHVTVPSRFSEFWTPPAAGYTHTT